MKTLIVYTTQHGSTEGCATKLQRQLTGETELINLKNQRPDNLDNYETIIIGGSIHAGQIQKHIKNFCQKNQVVLMKKRIGLFLCCMYEGEIAQQQFQNAYPDELINHAIATGIFGGEFNFEKMNFIEKAIVKKVAKINKSVSKINEKSITAFVNKIKK